MNTKLSLAFALFVGVLAPTIALAAVDQSQLTFNTGDPFVFPGGGTNYPLGQSFTGGLSGLLNQVTVFSNGQLGSSNLVTLELRSGNGTGGALLGSLTQSVGPNSYNAGLNGYPVSINTTGLGVNVVPGQAYTFLVTSVTGPGDLALRGVLANDLNPYAAGRAYNGPTGYGDTPTWDLAFQTSVVPEPGTMALVGSSLVGLVGLRRRQRTA